MTGGGNMDQRDNDGNWFTWGGQIGAPTAAQPQPCGEWTHRQHAGPGGKWTFHAGTASAPTGTEIDFVECCDEGWCSPARRAPAKQILWEGVGTFKNVHIVPNPDAPVEDQPVKGETFHWFEARVEDLGEPGSHDLDPELDCPAEGFACSEGLCGCPDFYTITIYKGVRPDAEGNLTLNKTDYIYKIYGYLRGGNHQIHPIIRGRHSCVGGGN